MKRRVWLYVAVGGLTGAIGSFLIAAVINPTWTPTSAEAPYVMASIVFAMAGAVGCIKVME